MFTLFIVIMSIITMILSLLFFPKIKLGKITIDTYYVITLIGALILIISKQISLTDIKELLFNDNSMNPIKIIILFMSMSFLSIYLDKLGFFKYVATLAATHFKSSQRSLFLALFILISVLTVFTSNDIIILTFTPFICYFAKSTKINPVPYLIGEFFAANTLSMTLIIGNPTNIYIASNAGITFLEYFQKMFIIGLIDSIILCLLLLVIFRRSLNKPLTITEQENKIESKFLLVMGIVHLSLCTILMAISNYINLEMHIVSLLFALSLIVITGVYSLIKKQQKLVIKKSLLDLPFAFIPFLLSMVILISCLSNTDVIKDFASSLANTNSPIVYGVSSIVLGNLLNNIPMSILYSELLATTGNLNSIYTVIASSNLCALITPLGSLAGMMFISLIKQQNIKFSFTRFMKYGFVGVVLAIFSFIMINIM